MNDHQSIMISSTARDLPDHRAAADAACRGLGLFPVMMEDLPALDADAIDASLKMVADATVYLGIFAFRYGYVPNERNPNGLSVTEMEYNHAVELGRPRLIFVAAEEHPDLERETGPGAEKLKVFRERVLTDRVVKFFRSADELRAHITQALAHWLELRLTWMPEPLPDRDHMPEPTKLPPGSRMLVGRNPHFVGRKPDMIALAGDLLHSGSDDSAVTVITPAAAVTGSGGIGKTQLAVEFAHRFGRYFHGVHLINLNVLEGIDLQAHLRSEIAQCGVAMDIPSFPDEQPRQVKITLKRWNASPPRLVILDNAANPAQVQDVLPMIEGTRVLVTSRWGEGQDWRNVGVVPVALDALTRAQSIELLCKLAPHLKTVPDNELDMLAERLGDYPLALDLAGRYLHTMQRAGLSVAEYRAALDESATAHSSLTNWAARVNQTNPTKHDTDVVATFGLSWAKVDDLLAQRLFHACGYLAPNTSIPPELLKRLAADTETGETNVEAFVVAQTLLVQYGLLSEKGSEDGGGLRIHPLLADFALGLDADVDVGQLAQVAKVLATMTQETLATEIPASFAPLRAHAEEVALRAEVAEMKVSTALWNNLGVYLRMIADYPSAREYHERALAIDERVLGPDHPKLAVSLNNLGLVLKELGDLPAARQHYERALAISERALDPDHPTIAIRLNNLGGVLMDLGDLATARKHFERALAIDERIFGPDQFDVAHDHNNLGILLRRMGDLRKALWHFERALAIDARSWGPNHPFVARDLSNSGQLLFELGDLMTADDYFRQALAIDERVYGPDHPNIAVDLGNLAGLLYSIGDRPGARRHFERALQILEAKLPSDHPWIEEMRRDIAMLYEE